MFRLLLAFALLVCVLVLTWMSFLRVNNLAHDVKVLQEEVARLKGGAPAPAGAPEGDPLPPSPDAFAAGSAAPPAAPAGGAASPPPPLASGPVLVEARTPGYLDEDQPDQFVPFPAGAPARRAEVTILAIQGDGASEVVLPDPIALTLQRGESRAVPGLCQGPETAAWVFTLEPAGLRVGSRECVYPVRGLRPRLRVRVER